MKRTIASLLRPTEKILRRFAPQTCPERSRRDDMFLQMSTEPGLAAL